ncbi:MAG: AGE family epimerase/isomerase [Oscillospiraceae bacterium]|nr:AGE family epimerase/isomerase [Oscillospiraceae bacterium]
MSFREELYTELTKRIIPFWKGLKDDDFGGFYGLVDFNLTVDHSAPKGCILNSRILWFFSNAFLELKDPELLSYAKHAYEFMVRYFVDYENGGVYWMVDSHGTPMDTTKHTYVQAFALYALSSYYKASGDTSILKQAKELFQLIEEKCADNPGYGEAYDIAFEPVSNEKLSENGIMAAKTMNTLLHALEAYAGLYQVAPSTELKAAISRILHLFSERVYNPKERRLDVFFDAELNNLIDLESYGHDIEASWLLDWASNLIQDNSVQDITSILAHSVYERAFHKGSLWNECENGVQDKRRIWWVEAEAVIGFWNEYQKHPEQVEFKEAAEDVWEYIKSFIIDQRSGSEWFWLVDDCGHPEPPKPIVEPWKCPYHNGRMCLELLRRLS